MFVKNLSDHGHGRWCAAYCFPKPSRRNCPLNAVPALCGLSRGAQGPIGGHSGMFGTPEGSNDGSRRYKLRLVISPCVVPTVSTSPACTWRTAWYYGSTSISMATMAKYKNRRQHACVALLDKTQSAPHNKMLLKPERMVDDVLMALSIYFAAAIKTRLMRTGNDVWTLLMLLAATSLWWKVEGSCARVKKRLGPNIEHDLFYSVVFEVVYIISQTMAFLLLQMIVHMFDSSAADNALWMQSVTLPCLLLLFCILLVVTTKEIRKQGEAAEGAKA